MNFDSLFSPFQYKSLTLRNRFVMAPMTRSFAVDGIPNEQITEYYARRAAAEVGLILTEGTVINRPASKNQKTYLIFMARPRYTPGVMWQKQCMLMAA